jgi:hypothetical protein
MYPSLLWAQQEIGRNTDKTKKETHKAAKEEEVEEEEEEKAVMTCSSQGQGPENGAAVENQRVLKRR